MIETSKRETSDEKQEADAEDSGEEQHEVMEGEMNNAAADAEDSKQETATGSTEAPAQETEENESNSGKQEGSVRLIPQVTNT